VLLQPEQPQQPLALHDATVLLQPEQPQQPLALHDATVLLAPLLLACYSTQARSISHNPQLEGPPRWCFTSSSV
jgi:hypothetical protein